MITNGMKIGEYRPDDSSEEIDIVVRLPVQYRTVGQLDDIRLQTTAGLVTIANFVDRVPKQKIGLLRRTDGNRAVTGKADVAPGLLVADNVSVITALLATKDSRPRIKTTIKALVRTWIVKGKSGLFELVH